jgi:transcriptional regulator
MHEATGIVDLGVAHAIRPGHSFDVAWVATVAPPASRASLVNHIAAQNLPLHFDMRRATLMSKQKKGAVVTDDRLELPQGTLDLLILKTLALGPQHGWAISERLHQISSATLIVRQGSLYPALHRLERRGWMKAHWGTSENNRRAKYYELTRRGRAQLEAQTSAWRRLIAAVAHVLETT